MFATSWLEKDSIGIKFDENEFRTVLRTRGKRESTINQYAKRLKKVPHELLGDVAELNKWIDRQHLKPSSRYLYACAIRSFYRDVAKRKDLASQIEQIIYQSSEHSDFLSPEQIEKVRSALNLIELLATDYMLFLALRRAIVIALAPKHFDFEKKTLLIPKDMLGNKSNKSWTINVPRELLKRTIKFIKNYNIKQDDTLFRMYFSRTGRHTHTLISPNKEEGYVLHKDQLSAFTRLFTKDISNRIGFFVHPHLFKHTKGTHFFDMTKDVVKTSEVLLQRSKFSAMRYAHKGATVEDNENYLERIGVVEKMEEK